MGALKGLARAIDAVSEVTGRLAAWLVAVMVLLGAWNAVVRYLGRYIKITLSSNIYIELQWYLFSAVFLLGAAHTLKHNGHVRVDAVYSLLGPRARAWINVAGTALFLIPFSIVAIVLSWPAVRNSWHVLEMSPDPGGLPRYPVKTLIIVGFVLVLLQGVAELVRQVARLRGDETETAPDETHPAGEGL